MTRRILALTLVLAVAPASADGTAHLKPEAQKHLDAALQAYKVKDWPAAIRAFEQAYAVDPDTNLLYAIAQAYRFDNDCAKALDYYKRYLASRQCAQASDRTVCEAQITAAQTGISLCEGAATDATAVAPPPPSTPPPPATTVIAPPSSSPAATATAAPSLDVTADVSPWYASRAGDGLAAAGVVGIGVGIGFLVESSSSESAAKSATLRSDFLRDLDDATSQRRLGFVSLGVGAALAAGGVWFYAHHHGHARIVGATDGHSIAIAGWF